MYVNLFTHEQRTLESMFMDGKTFLISDEQRPYSWQALDKNQNNNQVNQMWRDLRHGFLEERDHRVLFFGTMVVLPMARQHYAVVDGQQRLTTLILLLGAMKSFLESNQKNAPDIEERFFHVMIQAIEERLYNLDESGHRSLLKLKIQRSIGVDLDTVLNEAVQGKEKPTLPETIEPQYATLAQRYFDNRDALSACLRAWFISKDGSFTLPAAYRFQCFFFYLETRVLLVVFETNLLEPGQTLFEILSKRGIPLTDKDLLRNFFLREYHQAIASTDPNPERVASERWARLESKYPLTDDFISCWTESLIGEQRDYAVYSTLRKIYDYHHLFDTDPGHARIKKFEVVMEAYLGDYQKIREPEEIKDPLLRAFLRSIDQLDNAIHSRALLMAVFRYMDRARPPLRYLSTFVQSYVTWLWYMQLMPGVPFSPDTVLRAICELNHGYMGKATANFELTQEKRRALRNVIEGELADDRQARLLLLFYVWLETEHLEEGNRIEFEPDWTRLEHILPLNPEPNAQWRTDFSEEERAYWTHRLGNMTLLTSKASERLKNADFAVKLGRTQREGYRATPLPITQELVKRPHFTPAVAHERQLHFVETLSKALKLS